MKKVSEMSFWVPSLVGSGGGVMDRHREPGGRAGLWGKGNVAWAYRDEVAPAPAQGQSYRDKDPLWRQMPPSFQRIKSSSVLTSWYSGLNRSRMEAHSRSSSQRWSLRLWKSISSLRKNRKREQSTAGWGTQRGMRRDRVLWSSGWHS